MRYRVADLGALDAGKPLPIAVRYTKADARPSENRKAKANEPPVHGDRACAGHAAAPVAAATGSGLPNWALPLAAMALLGLLGSGLHPVVVAARVADPRSAATQFCAKCGAAQAPGSRFCAKCGAKVA